MPSETINYREKLIQFGIKSDLISPTLSNEDCQLLHKKLKSFKPSWIKEAWQLLAILGDAATYSNLDQKDHYDVTMAQYAALSGNVVRLEAVKERNPALFEQKDLLKMSVWHYAARSGNPEVLNWMIKHYPSFLGSVDKTGATLAHYAASADHPEILDWVKKHCPRFLDLADKNGLTIAHYAARLGSLNVLNWIKQHYPSLLDSVDTLGMTPAHYAAASGNTESLRWIKRNCPHLLTLKDSYGNSIATPAALYSHAELFNLALALSGNRHEVDFKGISGTRFQSEVMPTLKEALKTNTTLTDIRGIEPGLWAELKPMFEDNKRIQEKLKRIIGQFTLLIYKRNSQSDRCFPQDILFNLFTYAVKEVNDRISEKEIAAQFKKMVDKTENYKAANERNERIGRQIRGVLPFFNCQHRHFHMKQSAPTPYEPEVCSPMV